MMSMLALDLDIVPNRYCRLQARILTVSALARLLRRPKG
jgi:hypothetical protein